VGYLPKLLMEFEKVLIIWLSLVLICFPDYNLIALTLIIWFIILTWFVFGWR